MYAIAVAAGIALLAVALADIFTTVLHYEHRGLLTPQLHRVVWIVVRAAARPLPANSRTYVLTLGAPLMIVATLALWMAILVCGFALLYLHALATGQLTLAPDLAPTVVTAVYLSAVTLSTLGFGDVTPVTSPYQLITVVQALSGLGLATLTISYVLNVYRVLHRLNTLAGALERQFHVSGDPTSVLAAHFAGGMPRELSTRLHDLYVDLLAYAEGLHHYPLVYYFHSGRRFRSLPYFFDVIGELIAALRWGLPGDHPAATDPWLIALTDTYLGVTEYVRRHFAHPAGAEAQAASLEEFAAQLSDVPEARDATVRCFVDLAQRMQRVSGAQDPSTAKQLYARYRGWLGFSQRAAAFIESTAEDLAYDLHALGPPDWLLVGQRGPSGTGPSRPPDAQTA